MGKSKSEPSIGLALRFILFYYLSNYTGVRNPTVLRTIKILGVNNCPASMGARLVLDFLTCNVVNRVYDGDVHTPPCDTTVKAEFDVRQRHYMYSVVDLGGQRQKVPTCLT